MFTNFLLHVEDLSRDEDLSMQQQEYIYKSTQLQEDEIAPLEQVDDSIQLQKRKYVTIYML